MHPTKSRIYKVSTFMLYIIHTTFLCYGSKISFFIFFFQKIHNLAKSEKRWKNRIGKNKLQLLQQTTIMAIIRDSN